MNTSNIQPHMKLSDALHGAARFATSPPNAGFLRECAIRAEQLERTLDDDVRDFHEKFGHPAPGQPIRHFNVNVITFRERLIREECDELIEAIHQRSLAKIAAEAVDLIYVVVGTLVALGVPLMPFWRDIQRANMTKETNPLGGKPIKPEGWVPPDPAGILYQVKTDGVFEEPDGPEMG